MKKSILFLMLLSIIACKQSESEKGEKQETKNIEQYSIEQFYKNKKVYGGSFNNDEAKLLVSSNETGIFNVFEINISDGKKKQLTFSEKESYYAIDEVPNSNKILSQLIKVETKTIIFIYFLKMEIPLILLRGRL